MSLYRTKFDQLYRFIARKITLSRNLYRFVGDKNFGQKIVSLYSIFFSKKIVYLYRFNPLPHGVLASFCLTAGGLHRPPEEDDISREKTIMMT